MTYYPVKGALSDDDYASLSLTIDDVGYSKNGIYPIILKGGFNNQVIIMAKKVYRDGKGYTTYDIRPPRKGEWYISHSTSQAIRTHFDMIKSYYIARLVLVEEVTTLREVKL